MTNSDLSMNHHDRRRIGAVLATASIAGVLVVPTSADATDRPRTPIDADHCVLDVVDVAESGELLFDEERCFGTLAGALASIGVPVDPNDTTLSMLDVGLQELLETSSASALAVHYDGWNGTGASITVSGSDCAGGYTNLSAAWTNRVSSTYNFCPNVRFFDGYDKTGSYQSTGAGGPSNLSTLNNAANSVQYAS